jgi:UDP-N-acetylmuramate dehydrogenase
LPSAERRLEPRAAVPLAPFSTLGIGGPARWLFRATSSADVAAAHAWCADRGVELFVLGGGSNLVIADRGIDGLVLQIASRGLEFIPDGDDTMLRVEAGEAWDDVVSAAVSRGLAGFECLSGIPGSAGGTPIQNVGAYGQEVAETLTHVGVFDRHRGATATLAAADCGFAYRTSRFKREDSGRFIVCGMTFRLRPGPPTVTYPDVIDYLERARITAPDVVAVRNAVLAVRRRKGMVLDPADPDTRSVGSFFMNPVVDGAAHGRLAAAGQGPPPGFVMPGGDVKVPAAWLIEHAGFARGHEHGRVGLSSKHPLAIVNRGGATARDVLDLAVLIKRRVADRFGIRLRTEPVFAGFSEDDRDVQFLREG